MKRLNVLFFIFALILCACASTGKSNIKAIRPEEDPELHGRIEEIGARLVPVMDYENRAKYQIGILDTHPCLEERIKKIMGGSLSNIEGYLRGDSQPLIRWETARQSLPS